MGLLFSFLTNKNVKRDWLSMLKNYVIAESIIRTSLEIYW